MYGIESVTEGFLWTLACMLDHKAQYCGGKPSSKEPLPAGLSVSSWWDSHFRDLFLWYFGIVLVYYAKVVDVFGSVSSWMWSFCLTGFSWLLHQALRSGFSWPAMKYLWVVPAFRKPPRRQRLQPHLRRRTMNPPRDRLKTQVLTYRILTQSCCVRYITYGLIMFDHLIDFATLWRLTHRPHCQQQRHARHRERFQTARNHHVDALSSQETTRL